MASRPRAQLVAASAVLALCALTGLGAEESSAPPSRGSIVRQVRTGPTLVASGKAYFLHALHHGPTALRPMPHLINYRRERDRVDHGGVTLLHTARASGKMTVLARTDGHTWTNRMTRIVTGGTHVTRILGLIWDRDKRTGAGKGTASAAPETRKPSKKHLYALVASSTTSMRGVTRTSTTATLSVWNLHTGLRIASAAIAPTELPSLDSPPPRARIHPLPAPRCDVLTAGPLKLTQAGLTFGKLLFTLKDGKLTSKTIAPPK